MAKRLLNNLNTKGNIRNSLIMFVYCNQISFRSLILIVVCINVNTGATIDVLIT